MDKPEAKLIGANGNIFNLLSIATLTLKRCGQKEKADELSKKVRKAESYDEAIGIILEYVDPIESDTPEDGGFHGI